MDDECSLTEGRSQVCQPASVLTHVHTRNVKLYGATCPWVGVCEGEILN